jgi:glutaredoxin
MFCAKVKEFLSQNKIEFTDRNIAADQAALDELENLGYMTTPVTVIDGEASENSVAGRVSRQPRIRALSVSTRAEQQRLQ